MDNTPRTIKEAAKELNISPTTIRAWMGQRRIGYLKLGRSTRIPAGEILRLLESGYRPPERKY